MMNEKYSLRSTIKLKFYEGKPPGKIHGVKPLRVTDQILDLMRLKLIGLIERCGFFIARGMQGKTIHQMVVLS